MHGNLVKENHQSNEDVCGLYFNESGYEWTPETVDNDITSPFFDVTENKSKHRQEPDNDLEGSESTRKARKSSSTGQHQPDLLLQYVDSLEVHGLIDRKGEEKLCENTCRAYLDLYSSLVRNPVSIQSLVNLIEDHIADFGLEETIYFREPLEKHIASAISGQSDSGQCVSNTPVNLTNTSSEQAWINIIKFHCAHLNHGAAAHCVKPVSNEIKKLLSLVHIDVRVLSHLKQNKLATKSMKRAISVINLNREKLIHSNLRLVIAVARKFKDRGVSYVDLIQEGNIGLIKASARFDHRKGFKFSTYAHWWIWQSIKLAIAKQRNVVRLPTHLYEQISRLFATKEKLTSENNREPFPEELALELGVNVEKIDYWQDLSRDTLSFDMPLGEDGDTTLGDSYDDQEASDTDILARNAMSSKFVDKLLSILDTREQKIVRMRFGIGLHDAYTLDSIAHQVGLTRERVRQIEKEAVAKLQCSLKEIQYEPDEY